MRVGIIIFSVFVFANIKANAQDPKHKNFFKIPNAIETPNYKVEFSDVVAKMDYAKMAVKVYNKTADYLIFKTNESDFIFDFGTIKDKEDITIIAPNDNKIKTLSAEGGSMFHVDNFKLNFGGLYLVPIKGNVIKTEDFSLPASKNEIINERFKIKLLDTKQETDETWARFEVTYLGSEIGFVSPNNISVRVDGKDIVYANDNKRTKTELLKQGESAKFGVTFHIPGKIADMQFSKLFIVWAETFKESKAQKLEGKDVEFVLDEGVTAGKNK